MNTRLESTKALAAQKLKEQVVLACRIITLLHLDAGPFGNNSVRVPGTDTFWVNPEGITFDQVTLEDLVLVDIDGNVLEGVLTPHPGAFIHREIFRLRQDVNAIVHSHSINTVLHSLLGINIEPFTQLGASIFNDQGIYQGFSGPVRTANEGAAIAKALGEKSVVIAKNHGLFTAHKTMKAALWDFVVADEAAKIHLEALRIGLKSADKFSAALMQKSQVEVRYKQCDFMWDSFLKRLQS